MYHYHPRNTRTPIASGPQRRWLLGLVALSCVALSLSAFTTMERSSHSSPSDASSPYSLSGAIRVPNTPADWCFDTGAVDPETGMAYLADATNRRIDVLDLRMRVFAGSIGQGLFAGDAGCAQGNFAHIGPQGLVIDRHHQLWASDGNSTVKAFTLSHYPAPLTATIPTGGKGRADEMAYDPIDDIILVANPDETVPFATFINARTHRVLGVLRFPQALAGLEEPAFDPQTHLFYLSVPQAMLKSGGDGLRDPGVVAAISPTTRTVQRFLIIPACSPTGLAIGPHGIAAVGCNIGAPTIFNLKTGAILARVPGISGSVDLVAYTPHGHNFFFAVYGPAAKTVVTSTRGQVVQILVTSISSHSVIVADGEQGKTLVLAPEATIGVAMYVSK